ncbi:MAG: hypothetical protein JXQ74_03685 [Alphaproteobacteria bacterium]|nr:hypothetical protein [Alphaproteobacteria bacterium]
MSFWQKYLLTHYIIQKFKSKPWLFVTTPVCSSKIVNYCKNKAMEIIIKRSKTPTSFEELKEKVLHAKTEFMVKVAEKRMLLHYPKNYPSYLNEKKQKQAIPPFNFLINEELQGENNPEKIRDIELCLIYRYPTEYDTYLAKRAKNRIENHAEKQRD